MGDTKFSNLILIMWTESLSVTVHGKAVEQKFINFGFGTVRSDRVEIDELVFLYEARLPL